MAELKYVSKENLQTLTNQIYADIDNKLDKNDIADWAKTDTKPNYTAAEVGADATGAANNALSAAKQYTDTKVANLVNGAPETLDTLKEMADAIEEHKDVTDALNAAIGNKANSADLTAHINNKSNPHHITKADLGLEHVANQSPEMILGGLTEDEVVTALGYQPLSQKSLPIATSSALGGVKIGYAANGRNYPVQLSNEQMYVNVPWTDTNTTYTAASEVPKAAGPATVGTSVKYAREDHVHPLQTSLPGTAEMATKAIKDAIGQQITETYIKGLSVSGRTITYTKGDGNTGTITTQDTNTTYNTFNGATESAMGSTGLVPPPAAGTNTRYLRSDGTWQTPPDTTYNLASQSANGLMSANDKKNLDDLINGKIPTHKVNLPSSPTNVEILREACNQIISSHNISDIFIIEIPHNFSLNLTAPDGTGIYASYYDKMIVLPSINSAVLTAIIYSPLTIPADRYLSYYNGARRMIMPMTQPASSFLLYSTYLCKKFSGNYYLPIASFRITGGSSDLNGVTTNCACNHFSTSNTSLLNTKVFIRYLNQNNQSINVTSIIEYNTTSNFIIQVTPTIPTSYTSGCLYVFAVQLPY